MNGPMVHIMLHGLIALVPIQDTSGQWNHMMALLINAKEPRADLQCFVPHQALLTIATSNRECVKAGCSATGDTECVCEIEDFQDIRLAPDVQAAGQRLDFRPPSSLPSDGVKPTNFAYVGNLENLNYRIRRGLLDMSSIPSDPNPLIARMYFPFESANACALATRHDVAGHNVHPLNFRPIGEIEKENEMSQAMAQAFMAHYMLPADETGNTTLTLELGKPGDPNPRSMILKPGSEGYLIKLENKRSFALLPDDPCDDGVARDFSLFYDLVEGNIPPQGKREIPHVKYTQWKSATDLDSPECNVMKDPMSRPVCPMGAFYPAAGAVQ